MVGSKSQKQSQFWKTMMQKYEERSAQLQQEQSNLQQRLEVLLPNRNQHKGALPNSSSCGCAKDACSKASDVSVSPPVCACPSDDKVMEVENSLFSLNSTDLKYLSKISQMVIKEKAMVHQIQELQCREKAFADTLLKIDEMCACMESNYQQNISEAKQNSDKTSMEYEKMTKQLMEENRRLCEELQDAKLELQECTARLQGPIADQLERERRRSRDLEDELKQTTKSIEDKTCGYSQDVYKLKEQLNLTTKNLTDLGMANENLKREMNQLKCKYTEIQQDLINQKLSEAHTLERLNEALMTCQSLQIDRKCCKPSDKELQAN